MKLKENTQRLPERAADGTPKIEFSVIVCDGIISKSLDEINSAIVLNSDSNGVGILTSLPLKPGNIIVVKTDDKSVFAKVMWSVDTAGQYRVQTRYMDI